jgi:hypothetical protein
MRLVYAGTMALTFTFVGYTPNRAVYKITSVSGGNATLLNEGGVTPDLSTDIPATAPIGAYLRTLIASDLAGQNLIHFNTAFKAIARCTTATPDAKTCYWAIEAQRNATSGLANLFINSDADGTQGDSEGVLELELYHTIAK